MEDDDPSSSSRRLSSARFLEQGIGNIAAFRRTNLASGKRTFLCGPVRIVTACNVPLPIFKDVGFLPVKTHPFKSHLNKVNYDEEFAAQVFADHLQEGLLRFILLSISNKNDKIEGTFECFITRDMEFYVVPHSNPDDLDVLTTVMDFASELDCDFINICLPRTLPKFGKTMIALESIGLYMISSIADVTIFGTELLTEDSEYCDSDDAVDGYYSDY
ncbi:hypothetical protein P9112_009211 [Eukaryota sp. TZLM1-RC]